MSPPISIQNRPNVAQYVTQWRDTNEGKLFDFSSQTDQDAFLSALTDLARHLAHSARQAKIYTITSKEGISTVYINVDN